MPPEEVRRAYDRYVSEVSIPEAAISWELSVWLWEFMASRGVTRLLDTGSGWSSVLFRYYKKLVDSRAEVVSVETDPHWLAKTMAFLVQCDLDPSGGVHLWDGFAAGAAGRYQLVLHDLGAMEMRAATLETVLTLVEPTFYLVLDDMHCPELAHVTNWPSFTALPTTRDRWGRFAGLVMTDSEG